MSSVRIKDLQEKIDTLNDEDLIIIEDSEDTKKITLLRLRSAFSMDSILTATKNMLLEKINTFIENHSTKYKELEERNTQLEVICHNLENDHIHDSERIFELEDRLIVQTNDMINLQDDKNKLLKLVSELEQDKNSLNEDINLLSTKISDNQTTINDLQNIIIDLQVKCDELEENKYKLQSIIDTIQLESETKINNNFSEIDSKLSESIEDLMTYIKYYHPDVNDIFGEV